MKKNEKKELIGLLRDSLLCVRMVGKDYFYRDEEILLYCARLEREINRYIEKLEK